MDDKVISLTSELTEKLLKNSDIIKNICIQADRIKLKLRKPETCIDRHVQDESVTKQREQESSKQLYELEMKYMEMQMENEELKNTLELVLSQYRSQAQNHQLEKIAMQRQFEKIMAQERSSIDGLRNENIKIQNKLHEMIRVMREAASAETDEMENNELIEMLVMENEGLKEMLQISQLQPPQHHTPAIEQ